MAASLHLYNTLTRRKEPFQPVDPARVRMYVCGPTVYQRIHIGNARPFVVFDVLYRLLRHIFGADHVVYVRNITDIDDKIIDQANRNGESIEALTARTSHEFHADVAALGCLEPTDQPRATEHIAGMLALIDRLIANGHAYAAEGHVLFHVPSMPAYGRLSGRDQDEQIAGARVEVAPYKKHPADFVLWKPSAPDQPGWDSAYGRGRPGWHLECSAMSEHYLAPLPFDIHAGGQDLIFPHHENEIAQSCCAHDLDEMARVWLHNGFVDMAGEKMAKSVGNVVRVGEALDLAPGEAVRLWLLSSHYRQPLDYTQDALQEAKNTVRRFYRVLADHKVGVDDVPAPSDDILQALSDDLSTPGALAVLHRTATFANKAETNGEREQWARQLKGDAALLGLLHDEPQEWLKGRLPIISGTMRATVRPAEFRATGFVGLSDADVEAKLAERIAARKAKDFARADAIRAELEAAGIVLKDRPNGTTDWERR